MKDTNDLIRIGIFDRFDRADGAVRRLLEAGIDKERISVVCAENAPDLSADVEQVDPAGANTVPAIVAGSTIGTVLGGLVAAVGAMATGGASLLFVGPLLGGAAMGVAGGFIGAMTTRGVEPEIADFYDQALRDGEFLVAVEPTAEPDQPSTRVIDDVFSLYNARTHQLHAD